MLILIIHDYIMPIFSNNLLTKKVVLPYSAFELFYYGHDNIIKKAKEVGETFMVRLSTDKFNIIKIKRHRKILK